MSKTPAKRVEVLCMTYGEPAENDWKPQFEYSLSILNRLTRRVAPIPRFVTPLLAARRGLIRKNMFNEMGYHSPLDKISEDQAKKVGEFLRAKRPDIDFHSRMVMEFRPPYVWEHLDEIRRGPKLDELVILPLYLAESDFTTGISRTDLTNYHQKHRGAHGLPRPAYVDGFGFDPRLGKIVADFVWNHVQKAGWSEERCANAVLILGAHGTLQYPPEGINSGAKETLRAFGYIREHLVDKFRTIRVGWLNHTLGGKWTFPAVDETGKECWDQGIRDVVYFPFGFFGDNNESQNEGKEALEDFKWNELLYLPCPNEDDVFCEYLADRVLERLDDPMRERWNRLEEGGRRDLVQKDRLAVVGEKGAFAFTGPTLAVIGLTFWILAGAWLTARGFVVASTIPSFVTLFFVGIFSALIGWYKGGRIIGKVVVKNLKRLRRIPQPSPVWAVFSKPLWITIAFFMTLGFSLRFFSLNPAVYSTILIGVGLSLLYAALIGVWNFRESFPKGILSLEEAKSRPAGHSLRGAKRRSEEVLAMGSRS
ncbi:MAG: ferrochelatase [Candidatus Sumerlaeia bacterium]|nr:ferrochelatase [Candidatus Sumerlaeia bacterium]